MEGVRSSTYALLDEKFNRYLDGYVAVCLVITIDVCALEYNRYDIGRRASSILVRFVRLSIRAYLSF